MKILVIKPSSLGDVVHALPAVGWLRTRFPEAAISWLVNEEYAELVAMCPDVDEVIPFRRKRWGRVRHAGEFMTFLRGLRRRKFDLVVDFQGLFRSGFIGFCTRAPRRIGFADGREGAPRFCTERVRVPAEIRHAVDRNLFLVRHGLGGAAESATFIPGLASFPALKPSPEAVRAAAGRLSAVAGAFPLVAVAPCARWESKTWPPEFFAAVLELLAKQFPGMRCWLLGGREQRGVGDRIVALSPSARPLNWMGETGLGELLELLRASHVVITNDSGPMHLAAAVGLPAAALFGPTSPQRTGPYGTRCSVLAGCCARGPCFREHCALARQACRESVAPGAAAAAVAELISGGK